MASFEKAKKSYQKFHKERGQLKSRKKYGLLEKHKDYVLRARDYHKKQDHLKLLREKALNKNPDEFYFKMISSKTKDGIHHAKRGKTHTAKALKHMKTQDLNYVHSKRSMEAKKIEKLQASLHLLEDDNVCPVNQHVVFVDSEKEAQSFDAAAHFDTVPELVSRTYNRPRKETLKRHLVQTPDDHTVQRLEKQRHRCYEELRERIERESKLQKVTEELELQKHLMGKGRRVKIQKDEKSTPVYRWKRERKR